MFVRYFVELPAPADRVAAALLHDPAGWMPGIAQEAEDHGQRLLAEVGFGDGPRLGKLVQIEVGNALRMPTRTVLPMKWTATGATGLFPSLEADIEVAPLGPERTQVAISARYAPPLGALGRAIDRAVLHRVAEATVKDFLDRAGESLVQRVAVPD